MSNSNIFIVVIEPGPTQIAENEPKDITTDIHSVWATKEEAEKIVDYLDQISGSYPYNESRLGDWDNNYFVEHSILSGSTDFKNMRKKLDNEFMGNEGRHLKDMRKG